MKRSNEPFWWGLFSAGGMLAALVLPAHVLYQWIAVPLGWVDPPDHAVRLALVENPLVRLYLFALISLCLFHWGHRFRFAVVDALQVKHLSGPLAVLCYGTAAVISVFAAYTLLTLQ